MTSHTCSIQMQQTWFMCAICIFHAFICKNVTMLIMSETSGRHLFLELKVTLTSPGLVSTLLV